MSSILELEGWLQWSCRSCMIHWLTSVTRSMSAGVVDSLTGSMSVARSRRTQYGLLAEMQLISALMLEQ
eukprot:1279922-Rhodomonas_salina.1